MGEVLKIEFSETYLNDKNIKYLLSNYEVELKTNNFKAILDKILHESNRDILYAWIEYMSTENIIWPYKIIPSNLFGECQDLIKVEIPVTITEIHSSAFEYCRNLTNITIPNSITSIGEYAFHQGSSLENIYYEGSIEDWYNIKFNSFCSNPMHYASHFYMKNSNNEWEEVTEIEIPNTITNIGDYQLRGFNNVTSITIPNSVTSIEKSAFSGCSSLKSITIPNSVTSIGSEAFRGCSSLTNITIPNSVTSIGFGAFYECNNLTSITIPTSVTSIGSYAFYNCSNLTSIEIPTSVTSIGSYGFHNCNNLTVQTKNQYVIDYCEKNKIKYRQI